MQSRRIIPEIVGLDLTPLIKNVILKIVIPLILLAMIFNSCFIYVKPNEFGIKQVNIGIKRGIQESIYKTGYHFLAPFGFEVMHRFPRNVQVFELTNFPYTAAHGSKTEKAAHIQTSDGFFVDVDVSMLYRITDPYLVMTEIGPGPLYHTAGVVPRTEPKLKEALGEMTTEEFYNSPLRVEKLTRAKQLLNDELKPLGLAVDQLLVRYFVYSEEIQKNIEEKKLKDQLVFTNQSKAKATGEEAQVKKIRQEGEANLKVKLEEGSAYVVKKMAEKDLYVRTKEAEGNLLVKLADAKKTELINTAYQNNGSDKLIGLKMADVYKGFDAIILPSSGQYGINPLDLEKSMKMFGINETKTEK